MSQGMIKQGRRVMWAAALALGFGDAASAGTVIINANNSYNPPASTGDFYTGNASVGSTGWKYADVASQTTVGINTTYTDLSVGNGSVYFKATGTSSSGPGKASIQLKGTASLGGTFGELSALGYDLFRDGASTTNAIQIPVLRLYLQKGTGLFAPKVTLIYEPSNNGHSYANPLSSDIWHSIDAYNGGGGKLWSSGDGTGQLGKTISDLMSTYKDYNVVGVEVGVGSGWNGTFYGATDNITLGFTKNGVQTVTTYNFEVNGAPMPQTPAVPEPSSVAMGLIAGAAGLLLAARRRRMA